MNIGIEAAAEAAAVLPDNKSAEAEFRCIPCQKSFKTKKFLKKHQLQYHHTKPHLKCPDCPKYSFLNISELNDHKNSHHTKSKNYICLHCSKVFGYASSLRKHKLRFHSQHSHLCGECGETFTSDFFLSQHSQTKHCGKGKLFTCPQCPKSYTHKKGLTQHINKVHGDGSTNKMCTFCQKVFKDSWALQLHINAIHVKDKSAFKCQFCEKSFTANDYLRRHMQRKHKTVQKLLGDHLQ